MKKFTLILVSLVLCLCASAQSESDSWSRMFNSYNGRKDAKTVFMSQKMVESMVEGASDKQQKNLAKKISGIYLINSEGYNDDLICKVKEHMKKNCAEKLGSASNGETGSAEFYFISSNRKSEPDNIFTMISSSDDGTVIIRIEGQFDVKSVGSLSSMLSVEH